MDSSYRTFLAGRTRELSRTGNTSCWIVLSFVFMYMVLARSSNRSFTDHDSVDAAAGYSIRHLALLVTGQTVNIFQVWVCYCCSAW